jgi:hypothetical protein
MVKKEWVKKIENNDDVTRFWTQIGDQPMVSCFLLEMVLLVRTARNKQQLHYQA